MQVNKKDGKFVRGELYVFALQFDGTTLANGGNPKMVGKNLFEMNLKDAN
ncbi:MAG: histidine kinase, partial [Deltaproteobacteria bacterium]|nr:histidine kinase [Deltaproteobacteria bacterium]